MARQGKRKAVDRDQFLKCHQVASVLAKSVDALETLADDGDVYGNAIAIVAIHTCIAYADALCVRFRGFKSSEGDHTRVAHALREAVGARLDDRTFKSLVRVLELKDEVSYQGVYYRVSDAREVLRDMTTFCDWAEKALS